VSSKLPSGFKNREEYNKYMRGYNREYRKRKKAERAARLKELQFLRREKRRWFEAAEDFLDYAVRLHPTASLSELEELAAAVEESGWRPHKEPEAGAVMDAKSLKAESQRVLKAATRLFEARRSRGEAISETDSILLKVIGDCRRRLGIDEPFSFSGGARGSLFTVPNRFLFPRDKKPEVDADSGFTVPNRYLFRRDKKPEVSADSGVITPNKFLFKREKVKPLGKDSKFTVPNKFLFGRKRETDNKG